MLFELSFGLENIDSLPEKINRRTAVRAVIFQGNKLLMVQSRHGDYKFPGGGVESNESETDALNREVTEETGYFITAIKEKLGVITERKTNGFEDNAIFEMYSTYYLCEVSEHHVAQNLDDYEAELGFLQSWTEIDQTIQENQAILDKTGYAPPWVQRETAVLRLIKNYLTEAHVWGK